jgi:hypothetical protein
MKIEKIEDLLTQKEKDLILKCFEALTEEKKIYLSVLEKQTNIPMFVIKELLKTVYREDFLTSKIHRYDYNYYTLHNVTKNNGIYAIFQKFRNDKEVKQRYVHTWIVSKILSMDYKELVNMDLVAHHINLDTLDNRPCNLIHMPQILHLQYHRALEKKEDLNVFWYIDEYCLDREYLQMFGYYKAKIDLLYSIK